MSRIEELCIKTLMMLSVDAVERARSGHPGMPMGDAAMAYVLWRKFLRHSPSGPEWPNRDRFVLSAGHGSMLLYSLLYLSGHDISLNDIKNFRQLGSKTPGHPEYRPSCGIETTTGPLGQGFATGVGMAMAEKYLAHLFNRPGYRIVDYFIYGILSDGDLMEGVSCEAASLAGHLKLGKLIYLYSDNKITIEGSTGLSFTEDVKRRFDALGWHTERVDGYDLGSVSDAIRKARGEKRRPSLIIARTHIGFGSPKQDSPETHGLPLGEELIRQTKQNLGWPLKEFHVPKEVLEHMRRAVKEGKALENKWNALFKRYRKTNPELARLWDGLQEGGLPVGWDKDLPAFKPSDGPVATRKASGKFLNCVAKKIPHLIGGSSDLGPSNKTYLEGQADFTPDSPGRNIHFGVREHAMGAVLNGMALSRMLIPYGGTFLAFSDYLRPAERLSALMKAHVIYVFTHDSIGVGEDGPTHQPVEHLTAQRALPGLTVLRPADANETVEAWRIALSHRGGPVALILSRQKLPVIDRGVFAPAKGVEKGAYVVFDSAGTPEIILMASGSEVHLCLEAAGQLKKEGVSARVVNMASTELFERQPEEYRNEVLPPFLEKRLAVEAGATLGWYKYVGLKGFVLGIDRFGASAPGKVLFEKFGFTVENIVGLSKKLIQS